MARLMDTIESNSGEARFVDAVAEFLDDRYIVYRNRVTYGRELDVCILIPEVGVLVVEVKGWKESSVSAVLDGHRVLINTANGTVEQTPKRQAKGYRNALETRFRNRLGKYPLVFDMVCYPYLSREFFLTSGLDRVSEEAFTFVEEDLESETAFRSKLERAIALTQVWSRDAFTDRLALQVRCLFEPGLEISDGETDPSVDPIDGRGAATNPHWLVPLYSRFCYIPVSDDQAIETIDTLVALYSKGTKVYLVTPCRELLTYAVDQLNQLLDSRGLFWDKHHLVLSLARDAVGRPKVELGLTGFQLFNFQACLLPEGDAPAGGSFTIDDGDNHTGHRVVLELIHRVSTFNYEQYRVEHSSATEDTLVRAGAGTGKTHVMISRCIFLCYVTGIVAATLKKRIHMITFTNEAADNMKQRLKGCLQDYYLLSEAPEFLEMVSQVDSMQISTIHSYAYTIIEQAGVTMGFGREMAITSAELLRREVMEDVLEEFLTQRLSEDRDYLRRLSIPIYELRSEITGFMAQLNNKSVDISLLDTEQFGQPGQGEANGFFHELIVHCLPRIETEFRSRLLAQNRLYLGTMMSTLAEAVEKGAERLVELKDSAQQYLFIDEFQDTDDVQIDVLLRIGAVMNYRLFVVGDIKQCIYRFRGAEEQAFERLRSGRPSTWNDYTLTRNYRTDQRLLHAYENRFRGWGMGGLLAYDPALDALASSIALNPASPVEDFYRQIAVASRDDVMPALFAEVERCRKQLTEQMDAGVRLSARERTIAVLVRENWQAEAVREAGSDYGYPNIKVHTGGDLYQSAPALDLLVLISALLNNKRVDCLYKLTTSNFFGVTVDRSALYDLRHQGKQSPTEAAERQRSYLTGAINGALKSMGSEWTWEQLLVRVRKDPILQVLRQFYSLTRPWIRYSCDAWSQLFYHLNVDLLFEKTIDSLHVDSLSLNTLQGFLEMAVVTRKAEDCRWPGIENEDIQIEAITVHKSKGLEYGYVILPFASFVMDRPKANKMSVTSQNGRIGYSVGLSDGDRVLTNSHYDKREEAQDRLREETRVLYVAMTRAIRSFAWIKVLECTQAKTWQALLEGAEENAV